MKVRTTVLASILVVLCLIASGCHAPLKRAPKSPTGQVVATQKTQGVCDGQGAFLAAAKAKHPDMANLLSTEMSSIYISGAEAHHFVAVFNANPATTTPNASPSPTATPIPVSDAGAGNSANSPGAPNSLPTISAAASPSPTPSASASSAPLMLASGFVDFSSCAVDGYEDAQMSPDLAQALPTCSNPESSMGNAGASKQFAYITYNDSFKSPFTPMFPNPASEVYSITTGSDGTQSVWLYFFDRGTCDKSFPEVAPLTDPSAVSSQSPKSGH